MAENPKARRPKRRNSSASSAPIVTTGPVDPIEVLEGIAKDASASSCARVQACKVLLQFCNAGQRNDETDAMVENRRITERALTLMRAPMTRN
jgi:hypothetical protein